METAWSNESSLWGWFIAEVLARLGVRHAVVSPGSRSTPLTWALAHSSIEAVPILDERSAAYYALGLARKTGYPTVLVCTSGTAAANYFPAIIEAHESGTPLLVLTADRPPELRRCAAGQTVDQVKLYGSAALDFFELPVPEPRERILRHLRQTIAQALRQTMLPFPGPVHVNVPLREPLSPEPGKLLALDFDPAALLAGVGKPSPALPLPRAEALQLPRDASRILIVAGSLMPADDAKARTALLDLARRLAAPVLCDPLGPWRSGENENAYRIRHYDSILSSDSARSALAPDFVIQIGPLPTSKTLRSWLAGLDRPTLVLTIGADDPDAARAKSRVVQLAPEDLALISGGASSMEYAAQWLDREAKAELAVDAALAAAHPSFEGRIARSIFRSAPEGCSVTIANSMSVRDAESFREFGGAQVRTFFSRGANGIDGTLATALGSSHGGHGILLTGDLALLHDCGSLLSAHAHKGSMTVVLSDNSGGGIFETLPVAKLGDPAYETYFATPQAADFASLAKAFGADYELLASIDELPGKLREAARPGLCILHIRTDRKKDSAFRAELRRRVSASL
ncbi:MAG TPA: 2-succinyl-5-enolpyruvyl-6-hydroxy-3-cyclohexene-1-carboxylic-acid synthase [Opitutales bacterium]|nr:2-succinyl-5-enolpyruvyl-6-hydroxy-3-cyclohexene-1-carboxylic-acid synthase [Opitutales bacterium]